MKKKVILAILVVLALGMSAMARDLFLEPRDPNAQGNTQPQVSPKLAYPIKTFPCRFLSASSIKENINDILAEGEGASSNEKTNCLVVRASDETLKRIGQIVAQLDKPPLQVQVEAKIIQLQSGHGDNTQTSQVGANWKVTKAGNPNDYAQMYTSDIFTSIITAAAQPLGVYAQALSGNVEAYLTAVDRTLGYDLLASPWITALNNEPSSILIGSKYGYMTAVISQTQTVQQINYLEVGTKLTFTPRISEDGYVMMDIYPSVSEGQVVGGLPSEDTTETHNKVLVKDGQSIVIGGLTKTYNRQVETGTPILKDIPWIGSIFRKTELRTEKRDLMVIITPHIVTPEFLEDMSQKAKEFEKHAVKSADKDGRLVY